MNRATPEINFLDESQSRHAKMMAELNRLIAIIFDDPLEQGPEKQKEAKR